MRRRRTEQQGERGAVMVLVAVTLPVLALFVAFAIDVSHWFDYSRNLQNRADAAALAGGLQFGGTCLVTNPNAAAMNNIGQVAQNYAGAGANSDLYYPYQAAQTKNLPNLKAGSLGRYHVLINSQNYWQAGQTSATQSFTMGSPSTICSSLDEDNNRGPFVDVKVTQDNLPLFLPLFGFKPTINAHARVSLEEGTSETNVRPLAVRDDSATPCVSVNLRYASGPLKDTILKTITLSKDATGDPNFPTAVLWDNPAGTSVTMPSGANLSDLYAQPFLNNCSGSGINYDGSSGLSLISIYDTTTPSNGQLPLISGTAAAGGVFLTGCSPISGAYNQYFTSPTACQVGITANVAFAPNVNPATQASVKATDTSTGTSYNLTYSGSGTAWHTDNGPTITPGDGQHSFDIVATQMAGTIPGGRNPQQCGPGPGNPKPCVTDLGVHQQSFGACNGCGDPNESGPIVALRTRLAGSTRLSSGQNVFQAGTSKNLVFEVAVQGLHFDAPGQKATILRFGVTADKTTGLVDCGQGTGANADSNAITNGCPVYGQPQCKVANYCAPMKIYDSALHSNGICDPMLRTTSNPAYTDCVHITNGNRRNKIPGAIANLIVNQSNVCSPNHWPEYSANPTTYSFPIGDPRAITMIITSPADLSADVIVPIRNFATFYVTGWDTKGSLPSCNIPPPGPPYGNEPFPGTGAKNTENGSIWGHWIIYTDPNAGGNGAFCNPTSFGICTPVLSR
jgi:Flp pilus assembly protein TadG